MNNSITDLINDFKRIKVTVYKENDEEAEFDVLALLLENFHIDDEKKHDTKKIREYYSQRDYSDMKINDEELLD